MSFRELALKRISRRDSSSAELAAYLVRKGATPAEASELVSELVRDRWVDDERYRTSVVRSQGARGKGPRAVAMTLAKKGLKTDVSAVKSLLESAMESSEENLALAILERRYPQADKDRDEQRRAYGALMRRGFSVSAVQAALRLLAKGRVPDLEGEL